MILVLLACLGSAAAPPVEPIPLLVEPAVTPAPAILLPSTQYAACRARVEGVEAPGECTRDADCQRAGCSQEVCVPAAKAGEVMTACDVEPCFSILDQCGCHDGLCTWSLTAAGLVRPSPLPLASPRP